MNLKQKFANQKNNGGFTLIEVLIAMLIMSFGLLGVATMQIIGLKNTRSSHFRSQATNLANDYTDILRANKNQVNANKFGTAAADGIEFTTTATLTAATAACTTSSGCSADKMAETALIHWQNKVRTTLLQGVGTSERIGNIYTVSLFWVDKRASDSGAGADVNGDGDKLDAIDFDGSGSTIQELNYKKFTTSFQP